MNKNKIDNCVTCNLPHEIYPDSTFPKPQELENMCSSCKVDEAMHTYLRALRRKESALSLSERFFLFLKG